MAIQSSGPISMSDIVAEFGGTAPHSLSEYYGANANIPASGPIGFSNFYGESASIQLESTMAGMYWMDSRDTTDWTIDTASGNDYSVFDYGMAPFYDQASGTQYVWSRASNSTSSFQQRITSLTAFPNKGLDSGYRVNTVVYNSADQVGVPTCNGSTAWYTFKGGSGYTIQGFDISTGEIRLPAVTPQVQNNANCQSGVLVKSGPSEDGTRMLVALWYTRTVSDGANETQTSGRYINSYLYDVSGNTPVLLGNHLMHTTTGGTKDNVFSTGDNNVWWVGGVYLDFTNLSQPVIHATANQASTIANIDMDDPYTSISYSFYGGFRWYTSGTLNHNFALYRTRVDPVTGAITERGKTTITQTALTPHLAENMSATVRGVASSDDGETIWVWGIKYKRMFSVPFTDTQHTFIMKLHWPAGTGQGANVVMQKLIEIRTMNDGNQKSCEFPYTSLNGGNYTYRVGREGMQWVGRADDRYISGVLTFAALDALPLSHGVYASVPGSDCFMYTTLDVATALTPYSSTSDGGTNNPDQSTYTTVVQTDSTHTINNFGTMLANSGRDNVDYEVFKDNLIKLPTGSAP